MPFQKEKTLANGAVGDYWKASKLQFNSESMCVDVVLSLYKDNTKTIPLDRGHSFTFIITPQEIRGDLIQWLHTKVLAFANSDIPNINGVGTHKGCADLVGAIVVA